MNTIADKEMEQHSIARVKQSGAVSALAQQHHVFATGVIEARKVVRGAVDEPIARVAIRRPGHLAVVIKLLALAYSAGEFISALRRRRRGCRVRKALGGGLVTACWKVEGHKSGGVRITNCSK